MLTEPGYRWEGKGLDESAAYDLYLYITSDSDLYRQQHEPIIKNLTAKKARGVYNSALAAKLFGYLVENGAKKYYVENAEGKRVVGAFVQSVGKGWSDMFPKKLRDTVAEELRDRFEAEHSLGNYDNLAPKKHQKKPVGTVKKVVHRRKATVNSSLKGMR